jgi:hypothetical protein
MDISPDHVKEEKDLNPLPNVQRPAQALFNVAPGQEYGLQSSTPVFLKEEAVEEQRSEIELSKQVFIKEGVAEEQISEIGHSAQIFLKVILICQGDFWKLAVSFSSSCS